MKSKYDVLVVGGGPAGALAGRTAAEKGLSVLIVEKRPAIGAPVRCAEGIGKEALHEFIDPDPRWISADMTGAAIVAPDGFVMRLDSALAGGKVGYVLDRKIFDRELVWKASEAGADVAVKSRAAAPIMENGAVKGARIEFAGKTTDVKADVVIAADGVESKFSKWCGIDTTVPVREIMSSVQYVMTDIDIDEHATIFYLGNDVAPEGYLWVFPKGKRSANVGIGISGKKSGDGHRAKDYLDRFVKKTFPDGKTIEYIPGGVSVCRPLDCTVADGLMITGDAARVVDPLTGGGIYNAMYTGRLAAEVAAECIEKGDVSKKALMKYDRAWRESKMGKSIERNYHVKEYLIKQPDAKLNDIIHSVSKIDMQDFSTITLIKEIIKANPKLVLELGALAASLR
ncbi:MULTISPECIES: NAD(P)/FAD-dependent oxidoreductase [unclassified Methanoregula]|uniref:NAD(P)/FAD-dependent oxidoreductase n=1 Tax=unclassified Methanoregula TaxID=2649730 RepID=UPI0009C82BB8|nr:MULTISPECIES: NAD(P)/FAD-dependent oxidoreductase [unclassified Methanoregula]OPX64685.1 MAG: Digeranylgeranylglycerophospholipid reductase [Methanoregula sp. PtaB.Bin085]OPY36053.1 MAG: Digeranylgeranylglycerophospholipid reductase [Methanoregula sp. PtaU1.Bin006]